MAEVDLNAPVAAAQQNRIDLKNIFTGQRGETSDFLGRYTNTINSQPTTSAMAARIGEELGLPTLQKNALALQNTLYDIPETYSAATRGFDVNANQLSRIIGTKQAQIAPAAERAQGFADSAQNQLNTRLAYEQTDQAKQLLPYQSEQSLMSDRLARETTGYTTAMQSELDAITAKMNAGITISEGEKNRANQLAIAEKSYQAAIKTAEMSNNRQIALSSGQGIYDPTTGKYKQFGWG